MAYINIVAAHKNALPSVSTIAQKESIMFIASLIAKVQSFLRYRETVRELSKLSDRELDDLGIVRHDIANIARHYAAA